MKAKKIVEDYLCLEEKSLEIGRRVNVVLKSVFLYKFA